MPIGSKFSVDDHSGTLCFPVHDGTFKDSEACRVRIWGFEYREPCAEQRGPSEMVQLLLSSYLGVASEDVILERSARGKPALKESTNTRGIRLSMSHASSRLAVALTFGRECGVDIEPLDRTVHVQDIARLCCSAAEREVLASTSDPVAQRSIFLRLWTLKEAAAKTVGLGLYFPFRDIDVAHMAADMTGAEALSGRCTVNGSQLSCHSQLVFDSTFVLACCVDA